MKSFFSFLFIAFAVFFAQNISAQTAPTQLLPGQIPRLSKSGGTIFRCLFDPSCDALDGNRWPDYWAKKSGIDQGIAFPDHLEMEIVENRNPFSQYALQMRINGGAAAALTPKIPVRIGMSYTVSAYVDAYDLVYNDVSILLAFYGKESAAPLKIVRSEQIRNTNGWRRLEIGPIVADMPGVTDISVALIALPSGRQDFGATVNFTNVIVRESPTITLTTSGENNLFFSPRDIDLRCQIRGIDPAQHSVDFILEDPFGRVIARREVEMMIGNRPAAQFVSVANDYWSVEQGWAQWNSLPILSPGFYRVRIVTSKAFVEKLQLPDGEFFEDPLLDARPLSFVILSQGTFLAGGEFGWNLDGWDLEDIVRKLPLLRQSGISRLKIPAWIPHAVNAVDSTGSVESTVTTNATNTAMRRTLTDLCDNLSRQQVGIVGLLRPIPNDVQKQIKHGPVNAASLFLLDPKIWADSIQPTLRELSLLVKDWQWTADDDLTIVDMPDFNRRLDLLRRSFDPNEFGFGTGFAWDWSLNLPETFRTETPRTETEDETIREASLFERLHPANEFVALTSRKSMTPDELVHYLTGSSTSRVRRFVSLSPLPKSDYALADRVADLTQKMIVGKIGGAEALFLTKPIDDRIGVWQENQMPGELFTPWRTVSTMISGRRHIGSIKLPNKSRNHIFERGTEIVMAIWNDRGTDDKPIRESLYLGTEPMVCDVWGRRHTPELQEEEQTVSVTNIPVFVENIDPQVARFRMGFRLDKTEIPSVANQSNKVPFFMTNNTDSPVSARFIVHPPRSGAWIVAPESVTLAIEPGATASGEFDIRLTGAANTGLQPIRFDVVTTGLETHRFGIYEEIMIGDPELSMEFSSRMNRNGDIEVTQAFINDGDRKYTYSCRLYVRERAFQQSFVSQQGFGRVEHVYTVQNGRELIELGVKEMTVRANPVGAGQPMVYTIPLLRTVEN